MEKENRAITKEYYNRAVLFYFDIIQFLRKIKKTLKERDF